MNSLNKDELYQNLSSFLKTRGIELKDGTYAQSIQKSCHLLSEAINLGHQSLDRAKTEIDKKLEQMRQVIHEKTAPRSPFTASAPGAGSAAAKPASSTSKAKSARPGARAKAKAPKKRR
ncbi:MAG TPA: hypothetical protein VN578_16960 [Candidatus Binatia bacterium]|jgi:hypothetical protein|nr:hypothetical protein [Candidatus Binatia bacterium]